VLQGRQNDSAKDFKQAKAQGCKIVSPHWLLMCREQNARVEESLFPHTFNPNLALSVVSKGKTPLRTPRSSRRIAKTNLENSGKPSKEPIVITNDDSASSPVKSATATSGAGSTKGENSESSTGSKKRDKSPVKRLADHMDSPERSSSDDDKQKVGWLIDFSYFLIRIIC